MNRAVLLRHPLDGRSLLLSNLQKKNKKKHKAYTSDPIRRHHIDAVFRSTKCT